MALKIYSSNSMETLVDRLAEVVATPLSSPLAKEFIVVQSKGMQRFLSMELAKRLKVWANCEYPFPNKIVDSLFAAVLPDYDQENRAYAPEAMTWRLVELLGSVAGRPGFEPVSAYLADDEDGLKKLQLAEQLADAFDRYTIFRPQMVLDWEKGNDRQWQAELWRELVRGSGGEHRARLFQRYPAALDGSCRLPFSRLCLIGIPTLPPFHLEVLSRFGRHAEVNLFLLNPCQEYWGNLLTEKELARLERSGAAQEGWFEAGNPLLASLGKLGRDFFEALVGESEDPLYWESFSAPPEDSLLHAVQRDVLTLRGPDGERREVAPQDASILVHSCHSPMREVEVLHDTLLSLFDADPSLSPRDVIVMTPDIESYAPYISAVFDAPDAAERIPYSIADRTLMSEGDAGRALMAILRLCGGRFTATSVLDVLESPPVARRFAMSETDLETVREWLRGTNIRWGIDAAQRCEHGVPPFKENSWRAGLDRLLMGYAINGEGRRFCGEVLPFDDMEGSAVLVLGRFLSFTEKLFARCRSLCTARPASAWVQELRALMEEFLAVDQEGERELLTLREVADELGRNAADGGFGGGIGMETVRYWLEKQLSRRERGFGFLTGGVTFCAMLPMRSIPFRLVALIGMNDGAFPRQSRPHAFDLIAKAPRKGDRSLRDEDRYLFLEALLSARERLHVSYVGQSVKDNTEIPPSVLVTELLDYLERAFRSGSAAPQVIVQHRLQPFSPVYFTGDSRLFSYSESNYRGAMAKLAASAALPPFLTGTLPPKGEEETVTLKALVDFLCHPAKELLRRRLGIRMEQGSEALEESEPFQLETLAKYQLEQEIVAALVQGESLEAAFASARARGELPAGECGAALFEQLSSAAEEFSAAVREHLESDPLPPLDLSLDLPAGRIVGRIGSIRKEKLVLYRYTKLKAKDMLRVWVEHLALNCAAEEGYPATSVFLASDGAVQLPPVEDAAEMLDRLLTLYRAGMSRPLKFFPEASLEYVKKARDPKKSSRALGDARGKWLGSDFFPGEASDEYVKRIFGEDDPIDEEFVATALEVWEPVLACRVKE